MASLVLKDTRGLARRASPLGEGAADTQRFLTAAFRKISVQLVRGNAMMMHCAVEKQNRTGGKALREGLDVPNVRSPSSALALSCWHADTLRQAGRRSTLT